MCRLLGISYGPENKKEDLTTGEIAMLLFQQLTKGGPHAFGWFSYNETSDEIVWAKSPGRADDSSAQDWFLTEIDNEAAYFVGHTRYATNGNPEQNRNNHPIWHGDVVGVHNGVLSGWEAVLKETGRQDKKSKVDSEAIFAAVNKWGPVDGLKKIYGSAVTLFANVNNPETLYLGRTHGRSITIGYTAKGNMIFASEEKALWTLEYFGVEFVSFTKVSENRLLLIEKGKIVSKERFRPLPAYKPLPKRAGGEPIDWRNWEWDDNDILRSSLPDNDDDYYIASQLLRAERRGRRMSTRLRDKDGARRYVFHNGQYITVEEFEEIKASRT